MKKILFAALAALAITSCSQNEIEVLTVRTTKNKNEIGVNVIGSQTELKSRCYKQTSNFTSFKLHAYIVKTITMDKVQQVA